MSEKGFNFKYDVNTIKHLGSQMYNELPSLVGEMISNAYDAEAANVSVYIDYNIKKIVVVDDGHGMSFKDLNEKYLVIGRNRRQDEQCGGLSKNGKRKVTGKKGLGKLAVFGVATILRVTSISNGLKNSFEIDYEELLKMEDNNYKPRAIIIDESTNDCDGTKIEVEGIRQKVITPMDTLAKNLSRRFNFYDKNFRVHIKSIEKDKENQIEVNTNLFYKELDTEKIWIFPEDFKKDLEENSHYKFLVDNDVRGKIFSSKKPLPKTYRSFITYARGKMASNDLKYNDSADSHYNQYLTGFFHVDFIDEDNIEDVISTDREKIRWENNTDTLRLKESLDTITKKTGQYWRNMRSQNKEKILEEYIDEDFYKGLTDIEKTNVEKIKSSLLKNNLGESDMKEIKNVLESVITAYQFDSFREYVRVLDEEDITLENINKIANDWESIESKELAKIATGRIDAINKFEEYIRTDASETKVMQPFLEKFPWILNPKIESFEREVTFKKILEDNFPDDKLEGSNRRLDFLCNLVNSKLIIIELKRPRIKISQKEIDQALDYKIFIEKNHREAISNGVETYLISDRYDMGDRTRLYAKSLEESENLYIKSYSDLLIEAKKYNQEFINMYENLRSVKNL